MEDGKREREEGEKENNKKGRTNEGKDEGKNDGKNKGKNEGRNEGKNEGKNEGEEGRKDGRKEGMEAFLVRGAPGSKLVALCYSGTPAAHPSSYSVWQRQERVATPELVFVQGDLYY